MPVVTIIRSAIVYVEEALTLSPSIVIGHNNSRYLSSVLGTITINKLKLDRFIESQLEISNFGLMLAPVTSNETPHTCCVIR